MRRREFMAALGGAAAWPLVAHAQQPTMPVVGYLSSELREQDAIRVRVFRQGLRSNIAGRRGNTSAYLSWRLTWFAAMLM